MSEDAWVPKCQECGADMGELASAQANTYECVVEECGARALVVKMGDAGELRWPLAKAPCSFPEPVVAPEVDRSFVPLAPSEREGLSGLVLGSVGRNLDADLLPGLAAAIDKASKSDDPTTSLMNEIIARAAPGVFYDREADELVMSDGTRLRVFGGKE